MDTIVTFSALPAGDAATAAPPEWLHLSPLGAVTGRDGRGPYVIGDRAAAQAIIANSAKLLPVDENHATEIAKKTGQPSPARAWIEAMEVREDGIWGRPAWTPSGAEIMSRREYRGISPAWAVKDGRVLGIVSVALTNTPNIDEIHTLHSQELSMDAVRAKLGLPADATETAIIAAIDAIKPKPGDIALQAQAAGFVPQAAVIALQTELDTLKADGAKARAIAFVDAAIKAGKPIAAQAVRDALIVQHAANPQLVEAMVNAMPSINAGGVETVPQSQGGGGEDELTAEDKQVAAKMGHSLDAFKAHKKKMAGGK